AGASWPPEGWPPTPSSGETWRRPVKRPGTGCLPPLRLCGDNGAMIGAQGYYEYLAGRRAGLDLNAYATMELDDIFY
ncbi:MAG: hypothetical protein V8S97_03170, partial [Oscillospiraceae bacterium]